MNIFTQIKKPSSEQLNIFTKVNLAIFSKSSCKLPFSAGNLGNITHHGNLGNLKRHSRRSRQCWQYLHSPPSQHTRQSRHSPSQSWSAKLAVWELTASPESSAFLAGKFAVPAIPAGKLRIFAMSSCNLPFSADIFNNIVNPCILGSLTRHSGRSRQCWQYLHSRRLQQSRPKIVTISAVSVRRNLGLQFRHSATQAFLAGNLGNVGTIDKLSSLRRHFRQSRHLCKEQQSRQSRKSRQHWQYLHSRESQQSLQSQKSRQSFQSHHATSHFRPAISSISVFSAVGNLRRNLGLQISQVRHSQQCRFS